MLQVKDRNIKMKFRKSIKWVRVTHRKVWITDDGWLIAENGISTASIQALIFMRKSVQWYWVIRFIYGEDPKNVVP